MQTLITQRDGYIEKQKKMKKIEMCEIKYVKKTQSVKQRQKLN